MTKDGAMWPTPVMGRRAFVRALGAGALVTLGAAMGLGGTGCTTFGEAVTGNRQITDDVGRVLNIPTPDKLERIYFTSALAQIFCFTLNPAIQAGTAIRFDKTELPYLPAGSSDLPYMGSLADDGEINREMLMAENVQMVFSISATGLTSANVSDADSLQNATNIPVFLLDGSMENIGHTYEVLGSIFGMEERAAELGAYCEDVYDRVTTAVANVPEDERVSIYYAEGPEGLQTEPYNSMHALAFNVAGARNVAKVEVLDGVGMSNVSLEQVLAWNPDVIISWSYDIRGGADDYIRTSPNWAPIKAVADGRVYTMPNIPFTWLDRPPAVNRFLGVQWVANMLYPDLYDVDMVEVAQDFYKLFYQVDVPASDIRTFLGNSYPPYRG